MFAIVRSAGDPERTEGKRRMNTDFVFPSQIRPRQSMSDALRAISAWLWGKPVSHASGRLVP